MWKWIFGTKNDNALNVIKNQDKEIQALKEKISGLEILCGSLRNVVVEQAELQQKISGLERTNTILHNECNNKTDQIQVLTNNLTVANMRVDNQTCFLKELKRIIEIEINSGDE